MLSVTPFVTIMTSCLVVFALRRELPKTRHPKEYVSLVANVTNASFEPEKEIGKLL